MPRLQKLLILREHLLELLDKGLEHKLTLIAGPAGYGKTTSVSQWIAERGTRANFPHVASVTLDKASQKSEGEGQEDRIALARKEKPLPE